ncbi:hypothetical protein FA95DRAFT_1468963, partial [Auriscalpium vulgare]
PPISVPEDTGEGGKLKMIVQLVKRSLGVKDIAAMRLSLPASLLEPIPNLEYWHYLDRPDLFAAINDHDDPLERMLAVLRFTFSKDLRHIRGKVCKPYNSVLGEHFRSHWDVIPISYSDDPTHPPLQHDNVEPSHHTLHASRSTPRIPLTETDSIRSGKGIKDTVPAARAGGFGSLLSMRGWSSPAIDHANTTPAVSAQSSTLSLAESAASSSTSTPAPRVRVLFLTEQVSHHPPISAYVAACPDRNLRMTGIDQIAAKVTSTASVRIGPGSANKGLFVDVTGGFGEGERYRITHPVAHVNGVLRGSFYVTVGESTIITCEGGKGLNGESLRAIIDYKEESFFGKPHFLVEGVIHGYTPGATEHEEWTRVKHVPKDRVIIFLEGSWRAAVRYRHAFPPAAPSATASPASSSSSLTSKVKGKGTEWRTLLDLSTLHIVPKTVRPITRQEPNESRRLWETVTERLLRKEFGEATRAKQTIEQRQRELTEERKRKGVEFVPKYFEKDYPDGVAKLTPAGEAALKQELEEQDEPEAA